MVIKYHTIQQPPCLQGEVSSKPSETRQSDNIDIKETIARFFRAGGTIPTQQSASDLTAEEKEQMFESVSEQDLMDADISEQKEFVSEMEAVIESAKTTPTDEKKEEKVEDSSVKEATDSPKGE